MENKKQKSPVLAFVLGILFGPLGILYGSPLIGAILTVIGVVIAIVGQWVGMIIYWPVCIMVSWAAVYFENHSRRIRAHD